MIRDKLKNDEYFVKFLKYENERIDKFTLAINSVIQQRGENDEGVRRTYIALQGFYFNKLKALYSSGKSIDEIKEFFPKVLDIMEKIWSKEGGYQYVIWMASIGIMIDVPDREFSRLESMVEKENIEDILLDYLIKFKDNSWQRQSDKFAFERPYGFINNIFDETDKSRQVNLLYEYIKEKWYKGHVDSGWYDTHMSKNDTYSGYWSFESGAIVKIFKLDDGLLKELSYYPYDMVHYKDNI